MKTYWVIKDDNGVIIPYTISYGRGSAIKTWLAMWERKPMTTWRYWKAAGYSFAKIRIIESGGE